MANSEAKHSGGADVSANIEAPKPDLLLGSIRPGGEQHGPARVAATILYVSAAVGGLAIANEGHAGDPRLLALSYGYPGSPTAGGNIVMIDSGDIHPISGIDSEAAIADAEAIGDGLAYVATDAGMYLVDTLGPYPSATMEWSGDFMWMIDSDFSDPLNPRISAVDLSTGVHGEGLDCPVGGVQADCDTYPFTGADAKAFVIDETGGFGMQARETGEWRVVDLASGSELSSGAISLEPGDEVESVAINRDTGRVAFVTEEKLVVLDVTVPGSVSEAGSSTLEDSSENPFEGKTVMPVGDEFWVAANAQTIMGDGILVYDQDGNLLHEIIGAIGNSIQVGDCMTVSDDGMTAYINFGERIYEVDVATHSLTGNSWLDDGNSALEYDESDEYIPGDDDDDDTTDDDDDTTDDDDDTTSPDDDDTTDDDDDTTDDDDDTTDDDDDITGDDDDTTSQVCEVGEDTDGDLVCTPLDCNDDDPDTYPGAPGGVENDCDQWCVWDGYWGEEANCGGIAFGEGDIHQILNAYGLGHLGWDGENLEVEGEMHGELDTGPIGMELGGMHAGLHGCLPVFDQGADGEWSVFSMTDEKDATDHYADLTFRTPDGMITIERGIQEGEFIRFREQADGTIEIDWEQTNSQNVWKELRGEDPPPPPPDGCSEAQCNTEGGAEGGAAGAALLAGLAALMFRRRKQYAGTAEETSSLAHAAVSHIVRF